MTNQMEKNKELLLEEMERLASRPLDRAGAERLALYRDAYKALCLVEEEGRGVAHAAAGGTGKGGEYGAGGFSPVMAGAWTRGMQNEDGSAGPHWTMEQAKQVMVQRGIDCDPYEFWVAINAEYSDRCAVNKKHGVNNVDFYADSALAFWLNDKDAVNDKLAAYYQYVVKH